MAGGYPGRERIVLQPAGAPDLFEARIQGFDEVQGDVSTPFRMKRVTPTEPSDDKHLYRIDVVTEGGGKAPRVTGISLDEGSRREECRYRLDIEGASEAPTIRFVTLEPTDASADAEFYEIEWADDEGAVED